MFIDVANGGVLMGKSIEATRALLEEMTSNINHRSSERAIMKKDSGMYGVYAVDLFASKVNAFTQQFDRLGDPFIGSSFGMMYEIGAIYEIFGI